MIFNKENYKDIIRYYEGTIIKLKEAGDRLWRIRHISTNEVELVDVDGFNVWLDLNHDYEVDYPLPGRAVYQGIGGYACMLFRKPAKQYFRGLCSSNTAMLYLRKNGTWSPLDVSIEKLQQFVDKPCYQSLDNLTEGYESFALSPVFSVSSSSSELFALNRKVGYVDRESKQVEINSLLKAEMSPLIPNGWKLL